MENQGKSAAKNTLLIIIIMQQYLDHYRNPSKNVIHGVKNYRIDLHAQSLLAIYLKAYLQLFHNFTQTLTWRLQHH